MPRITLNDRAIARLKPATIQRDYFDRALPGFGVRVSQHGTKSFILMYRNAERKLKRLTLGTYGEHPPDLTLATAREKARAELQKATEGRDPAAERKTAKAQTFGALAERYLEKHARRRKRSWRDDARMIRQELNVWTERPATSIRRSNVRDLLDGIVDRGAPVLANRVLSLVRKIFNFGLDQEWVEANPAQRLARPSEETSRTRVLSADELRTVWEWLNQVAPDGADATTRKHHTLNRAALKLRLVTAQRGGEVIAMRWQDVDLDGGWWTIPSEHAKNKLPHRVPLTTKASAILRDLRATAAENSADVFNGIRGTRQRRGATEGLPVADVRPHDFRRTAASMMTSAGVSRLVVGKVLNHAEKGITAVYDRHSYDAEKRVALETWERTLQGMLAEQPRRGADVVPLRRKRQ